MLFPCYFSVAVWFSVIFRFRRWIYLQNSSGKVFLLQSKNLQTFGEVCTTSVTSQLLPVHWSKATWWCHSSFVSVILTRELAPCTRCPRMRDLTQVPFGCEHITLLLSGQWLCGPWWGLAEPSPLFIYFCSAFSSLLWMRTSNGTFCKLGPYSRVHHPGPRDEGLYPTTSYTDTVSINPRILF